MDATRVVDIDSAALADAFARRSIAVRHDLVDHPLFSVDAIAELADRLPPESVRREHGHLPLAHSGYVDGVECDFGAMQAVAETFDLEPCVGVYLPSYVPHWVETEAGVSISFSIPFYTAYAERREAVFRMNRRMRQLHLSPRPPGAS